VYCHLFPEWDLKGKKQEKEVVANGANCIKKYRGRGGGVKVQGKAERVHDRKMERLMVKVKAEGGGGGGYIMAASPLHKPNPFSRVCFKEAVEGSTKRT